MMKRPKLFGNTLLLLAALIWGLAFVAQAGGAGVGNFTFNCLRTLIGGAVLVPVILVLDRLGKTKRRPVGKKERRTLLLGGLLCGTALCVAMNMQQVGINLGASTGKAGFLTACYILIVPVLGIFFRRRCGWNVWVGVVIAMVGLYFLCVKKGDFSFAVADLWLVACAFAFSVQIMLIDYFSPRTDPVRLSCLQFLVCGILSGIVMIFAEVGFSAESFGAWRGTLEGFEVWKSILFLGFFSTGVAYTLQVVAQPGLNPTVASMIMSLESAFALLFGWLLLGQRMSGREMIGCGLVFSAVIIARLPGKINGKRA